ncbi:MAG: type III secretion system export apparatus subunit SctR [Candidatus Schekmanbacteria bacterium]|nr:type III secretion system export apparatus subunit SctR [Candidatus Schekmanbacteria bacterium]
MGGLLMTAGAQAQTPVATAAPVASPPTPTATTEPNVEESLRDILSESRSDTPVSRPMLMMGALVAVSLAPFLLTMVTSFVKVSVTFSILRNALGTQQIPPNQIIIGLSMILTIFIMMPVGARIHNEIRDIVEVKTGQPLLSNATVSIGKLAFDKGKEPLREFLEKHAHKRERMLFYSVGMQLHRHGLKKNASAEDRTPMIGPHDFMVLIPAFAISQLKEAFQIGFILFVPFLVIDMIVANVLQALGMSMLSPTTISLPFKILLFVLIDGWYLLTKGLVIGYL